MPKARTAKENKEWWQARATEYAREAARYITAARNQHWLDKAAAALAKAETYTSHDL